MLILSIILTVTYVWLTLLYGECTCIEPISFLVIGYVVSGIIFRAFKKSAKKFSNTVKKEKSSKLESLYIYFGIMDVTTNWLLILPTLYLIATIVFFLCGCGYIRSSEAINLNTVFIAAGVIEIISVLAAYISSKKKLIKCIFAIWFMEAFALNIAIFFLVLIYLFCNVAMAWILLFIVISLIFLN